VDIHEPRDRDRPSREPQRRRTDRSGPEERRPERAGAGRVGAERRRPGRREPESREPGSRLRPGRAPSADAIARLAADYVAEMTGKDPEGIVSLEQPEDDRWTVGVEVVETRRIPDSTDILAVYEVELDAEGELLAYRRVKRYSRCQLKETS
jgi:phenylpyruvate tautomerase PptA (4-oxalocrotonate tautomerase family)